MRIRTLTAALLSAGIIACGFAGAASADDKPIIGLITKNTTNPFFVTMRRGAQAEADKLGVELRLFAGKDDADNQGQVDAIENLISAGAKGILITASDPTAIIPTIKKARDAGLVVIALDTALNPIDAADATLATDNFAAGVLIGQWAKAKLGDKAKDAHIALIDENINWATVVLDRDQGFLKGFGIDIGDPKVPEDEHDPRIAGHAFGNAAEEPSRTAMENLLQKDPQINLVYTVNEPAAVGAYAALKAAGRTDALLVTVDASCPGVRNVADGVIQADSMQFPLKMATEGVDAIVAHLKGEPLPKPSDGLAFTNTGTTLVASEAVQGVDSISAADGLKICWE